MKKLVAIAAILSTSSLFALDAANIFGVLRVDSDQPRTIVAIPWIQASLTNGEISVADIIMTSTLSEGDTLHYYNGSKFESWKLNANKTWDEAVEVTDDWFTNSTPAVERVLTRGNAIMLIRTNNYASSFYLMGQVASRTPTNKLTRSDSAIVYHLIAPPLASDATVDINDSDSVTWNGVNDDDRIYFQTSTNRIECKRKDGAWKNYAITNILTKGDWKITQYGWTNAAPITVGTGFWYVTSSNKTENATVTTEDVTVNWVGAPTVNN